MHERMTFPWTVGEAVTYIVSPDGVETIDPESPAVQALPDLIEALKDARGWLEVAAEYGNGHIGKPEAFKEPIEKINAALVKAGVGVAT